MFWTIIIKRANSYKSPIALSIWLFKCVFEKKIPFRSHVPSSVDFSRCRRKFRYDPRFAAKSNPAVLERLSESSDSDIHTSRLLHSVGIWLSAPHVTVARAQFDQPTSAGNSIGIKIITRQELVGSGGHQSRVLLTVTRGNSNRIYYCICQ